MWSRLGRVSPLVLVVAYASCSGGASDKKEIDRAPSPAPGSSHASDGAGAADRPNSNGPGLRGAATESLKLPVPRAFDLSHVEPRYFAAALGHDPARIFEFVRDHIAFEPYRGCLRGPRGTLMAMAGNAVDRAALLGSLLSSSGQQIRYAHGKLTEAVAQDLVASLWAQRASGGEADSVDPSPELKADIGQFIGGIGRDASFLTRSLGKAGLIAKGPARLTRDSLVKEAQDHYWIEWSQNGKWTALDPSFATATPGQRYAASDGTFEELPDSLYHRVEVRVRIEEYQGDQPAARELLDYSGKAADLSSVDLFVSHQLEKGGEGTQFRPVLTVRQDTVIGLAYVVGAPAAKTAASGGLADALAGDAESVARPIASALFVDFDLLAPDGRKETVVREIFDRIGKRRRMSGTRVTANELATGSDGAMLPAELLRGVFDFFVTTGAIQQDHLRNASSWSAQTPGERPTIGAALRMINIAFAAISDGLTGRIADSSGQMLRTYPDAPRIYVAELSDWKGRPRLSLDLRHDRPRVAVSGFDRRRLFVAEVLRGVVAGAVEREVIEFFATGSPHSHTRSASGMSTNLVFERAEAAKIEPVLLSGNSSPLSKDLSSDVRARIEESLAAGQIVVAPRQAVEVDGAQRFAWWSIDRSSGATTAVTDEGLYQTTAEGSIVRNPSGEVVLEIRAPGTAFEQYHAANAEQAVHWVRNLTANYKNLHGITIHWEGLPELWNAVLLGL
jgi:hypothetical protein